MDTMVQPKSVGSTNVAKSWSNPHVDDLYRRFLENWGGGATLAAKEMFQLYLVDAFKAGQFVGPPPLPPDKEQIRNLQGQVSELETKLAASQRANNVAGNIMDQMRSQIALLSEAPPLTPHGEREFKALQNEIKRLQGVIRTQVDELNAMIEKHTLQIKAFRADINTDEGKFIIEQQYEREYANVVHLHQQIFALESQLKSMTWQFNTRTEQYKQRGDKIAALEKEIERLRSLTNPIDLAIAAYKKMLDEEGSIADVRFNAQVTSTGRSSSLPYQEWEEQQRIFAEEFPDRKEVDPNWLNDYGQGDKYL